MLGIHLLPDKNKFSILGGVGDAHPHPHSPKHLCYFTFSCEKRLKCNAIFSILKDISQNLSQAGLGKRKFIIRMMGE